MTKHLVALGALLTFLHGVCHLQAQRKAELTFKDGNTLSGLAKINIKHEIEFKENIKDKKTVYDHHDIKSLIFKYDSIGIRHEYKILPEATNRKVKLLHLVLEGKINLYEETLYRNSNALYTPFPQGFGGFDRPIIQPSIVLFSNDKYVKTTSYISKSGQYTAVKVHGEGKKIKNRLKKRIDPYFNDCPGLVKKINLNEFGAKELREVVVFYNANCSD